ncbi:MAG TPA: peptidylprolyl isomerase [Vicinamibacterales bacterium]|nr:peptidylprolyl isomerase [Vicinamibacterales bacterium]
MNNLVLASAIVGLLVSTGCNRTPQPGAPGTQAATPTATGTNGTGQAPAPEKPEPPKPVPQQIPDVVARVDGEPIPKAEFDRAVKVLEVRAGGQVPAERRDEILRGVLDSLVTYRVLANEAHRRNLDATDEEFQQRASQVKKQFPDDKAFTAALKERGMDPQRFERDMRGEISITKLMQSEAATATLVSESDAKDFYDKNPDRFKEPETVRASHIFKRAAPADDEATKQKARAALEPVLKQVKSGADFAELARKHSEDGSAQAGGDLNFFGRGQMVPEFEKVAFALKPGQTSDIVQSQFGYHIIKVTERRDGRIVPFLEAKEKIAEFLKQQRQQEKATEMIRQLKAKAKIEILM